MTTARIISFLVFFLLATLFGDTARGQQPRSDGDSLSHAAAGSPSTVDTIILEGNEHTKDFVILREMTLQPGAPITQAGIEYDKNRIYSLGLFNSVDMRAVPSSVPGRATLYVKVTERWYIFPYPIFGLKDRDWSKVFYGFGFLHANFRGRNEKLFTSAVFGYDPSVGLAYRNPFLSPEGTYYIDGRLSYGLIHNRSILAEQGLAENFDERHFSLGLTLGRRIAIEHTVWISTGFELVDTRDRQPPTTIARDGRDTYPVFSFGYLYDTRDLAEYASMGLLARTTVTKYGLPGKPLDFVRYNIDLRRYQPLTNLVTLQGRIFTDLVAGGAVPSYNHDYFGYGERIRGHFKEVLEGESMAGASLELHVPILPPRYFVVGLLPRQFGVWRFGMVAAAFADAGTVWFRGDAISLAAVARGYGGGIHLLLPYGGVLRLEYAWNELRRGEFILDVGAPF